MIRIRVLDSLSFVLRGSLVALLLLASAVIAAAEPTFTRFDGSKISLAETDAIVQRLMAAAEVTGLALGLVNGGEVVYLQGYGLRNTARQLPVTADTVFGSASLTKVVFAYLAMKLVDDGVLSLDKTLESYLPQPLPSYARWQDLQGDARYRKLTARMLLSHISGFANFRRFNADRKLRIFFEPGSRYAYSGEGLQLLQFVIEIVTKQNLQELARTRVFEPLGMHRTSMISEPRFADDLAEGYDEWGRSYGTQRRESADAAGSMQTTLRDYVTFMRAVMQGQGLSQRAHREMLRPQVRIVAKRQFPTLGTETTHANDAIRLSYGLGVGLYWTPRGKAWFKEGHDNGFRHYCVAFEDTGQAFVVLTNSNNGEGVFKELLETVLGNRLTPIEWEAFTPWTELPPRGPAPPRKQ